MGLASTKIQDFKVLGDWRGCWEIGGVLERRRGFGVGGWKVRGSVRVWEVGGSVGICGGVDR